MIISNKVKVTTAWPKIIGWKVLGWFAQSGQAINPIIGGERIMTNKTVGH